MKIEEGRHAIIEMVSQPQFIKVVLITTKGSRHRRKEKLGKLSFSLKGAIGHPYGTVFEVESHQLSPKQQNDDQISSLVEMGNLERGADNRDLQDDTMHQRLSSTQIYAMKKDGTKREEVIKHIVASSDTYKKKTEFSQAKYLERKKRQHLTDIRFLKPTLRTLWRVYNQKAPVKICYIREDTLAMLFLRANLQVGGRYLMLETCNGLIAAGIIQRIGGHGSLVQLHTGNQPPQAGVEVLDLSPEARKVVLHFPISAVSNLVSSFSTHDPELHLHVEDTENHQGHPKNKTSQPAKRTVGTTSVEGHSADSKGDGDLPSSRRRVDALRQAQCNQSMAPQESKTSSCREQAALELLKGNFDALVIVARYRPCPLVRTLFQLIAPSRPVVIFHQFREALIECISELRGRATDIEIKESFMREYQVLPQRTHPMNNTTTCSGFLLTATTLANPNSTFDLTQDSPLAKQSKF
eukprot:gene4792-6860_t